MKLILAASLAAAITTAAAPAASFSCKRAAKDFALTADPRAAHWKRAVAVQGAVNPFGKPAAAGDAFQFRTLWTDDNLYFLFECPYTSLNLKPNPSTTAETNKLWEWDVTEVFIGSEMDNIRHYRELQVSPQGEWVDLDIDRNKPLPDGGWRWDSGMTVKARVDQAKKIWYGEMKVPMRALDARAPKAGNQMRINVYRLTGAAPSRTSTMWVPTNNRSHHAPEAFGIIELVK